MQNINRIKQLVDIDADPKGAILRLHDEQAKLKQELKAKTEENTKQDSQIEDHGEEIERLQALIADIDREIAKIDEERNDTLEAVSKLDMDVQTLSQAIEKIEIPDIPLSVHGNDGIDGKDGFDGKDADETFIIDTILQKIELPEGKVGNIPKHEWRGTSIRFEKEDGEFGPWTDLKGQGGKRGGSGGASTIRLSDDGTVLSVQAKELDFLTGFDVSKTSDDDIFGISLNTSELETILDPTYLRLDAANDPMQATLDMGAFNLTNVSQLQFNTGHVSPGTEPTGSTYWDSEERTLSTVLEGGIVGQHFKEQYITGQNDTGSTITNGTPVMYDSSIGNSGNIRIVPAIVSASAPAFLQLGISTQDITDTERGEITTFGKVRGIQTDGVNYGEVWSDADVLYISGATAGSLTKVPPNAPLPSVPVAVVISAHATNGTLFVRPSFPTSMQSLSDVNGTPLTTSGQFMVWDQVNQYFDADFNINDYLPLAGGTMTGQQHFNDDILESFGNTILAPNVKIAWDTAGVNANHFKIQVPAGGATDVPVVSIGKNIIGNDLGFGAGVIRPTLAIWDEDTQYKTTVEHYNTSLSGNPGGHTEFTSDGDMVFSPRGGGGTSPGSIFYLPPADRPINLRVVFRARKSSGLVQFEFGHKTASYAYFRWEGAYLQFGFVSRAIGGRSFGIVDDSSVSADWGVFPQDNPTLFVKSTTLTNTDDGEHAALLFNGLRCGQLNASSPETSTLAMQTDRATYDFTISAVNARATAVTNVTGGNLILKAGNGVTTADDGIVQVPSHVFETGSGRITNKTRVTTTYTVLVTDHKVFSNSDAGDYTVTLPPGVDGQEFVIKNTGSSSNQVTVTPDGAEHLLGANSGFTLNDGEDLGITYDSIDGWY